MLKLTNTLTGKKESFRSIEPGLVLMYVCGVTPYDMSHIGHGRCYVTFDLLYRLLMFLDYEVRYCRNLTDIDDKLINKAIKQFGDGQRYVEIADEYITRYHDDMRVLGCLSPTIEPRVTQNIPVIVAFIQELIDRGYAYEADGDVYYHIPQFKAYPRLSKHNVDDLRAGERVEVGEHKRDPLDFALWKSEPEGTFFESPWGWGRPGWHIECSALAAHYLGEHIDIHGGGMDLVFPHHDNEIAQSEARFGPPFANYWVHNGLVRIDQEKMSKSLGNVFNLHPLFEQYDPMVVRFYFLSHGYRAPLEFSLDGLDAAAKAYGRIVRQLEGTQEEVSAVQMKQSPVVEKMVAHILDDMNTPGALGVLFDHLTELADDSLGAACVKRFMQQLFGLTLASIREKEVAMTPEIELLIAQREEARIQKDWARADEIRDKLRELGVDVQDKKLK